MTYTENRKARHIYTILETFEAGIVLTGSEAKAVREGGAKLDGAYISLQSGLPTLIGAHIRRYSKDGRDTDYAPNRPRHLLLHKKEWRELATKMAIAHLTVVPLSLYSKGRHIKLQIALVKGKKAQDKRETLKKRDLERRLRTFGEE